MKTFISVDYVNAIADDDCSLLNQEQKQLCKSYLRYNNVLFIGLQIHEVEHCQITRQECVCFEVIVEQIKPNQILKKLRQSIIDYQNLSTTYLSEYQATNELIYFISEAKKSLNKVDKFLDCEPSQIELLKNKKQIELITP